jgi:glutathione synthase/RimK-type ligase-like ATP-grasp enzyme
MAKNPYMFYSAATDTTGKALADTLKIAHGSKTPGKDVDLVIGWGTKAEEKVVVGKNVKTLNHPDVIKGNRNKFGALKLMSHAGVNVAPFVSDDEVLADLKKAKPSIAIPCIARTCYHQGGAGFMVCLTKTHIAEALKNFQNNLKKKSYFQNYIDVKTEYRLHVFNGKVIAAAKKTVRDNMEAAYVEQQIEKVKAAADKKKASLDENTLKFVLSQQAKKISGPDNIIKSNTRGYKFSPLDIAGLDKNLVAQASKAVAAVGLDFGAVDCVIDQEGKAWVLEVNSGPGLEGTAFDAYVAAFKKFLADAAKPKIEVPAVKKETTVGKVVTGVKGGSSMAEKLRVLAEIAEIADESEMAAINSAAKKLFG